MLDTNVPAIDLEGTIRTRCPEETLALIQPLVQEAGITRLASLTHLDSIGLPVYTAIRPQAKSLATSQGKGLTDSLAACSALMESLEYYFAENICADYFGEPQGDHFIAPETFQEGNLTFQTQSIACSEWSRCVNLLDNETYFIPTALLDFDLTKVSLNSGLYYKSSNGLASGNTKVEAVCHALYELIERDAIAHFETLSPDIQNQRLLDLHSVNYPPARKILDYLVNKPQTALFIHELNSPYKLPCFQAVIAEQNTLRSLGHYSGYGCHSHPGIALTRAISEAMQSRVTYIAGSRDDMFPRQYQKNWLPLSFPLPSYQNGCHIEIDLSFATQLELLLTCLKQQHKHILIYDHTPIDCPISIVKAIIPDMPSGIF